MSKWEMVRLGALTKIKTGKLDANASSEDGQFPFFTCAIEPLRISSYSYDCECVLVAGNGDLNVKYYCGKFDAYQRTYIVESTNKQVLTVKYLYFFLSQYVHILRQLAIGGVIKYIKLGNLTEAIIPIPPLETQREIAAQLDVAAQHIALRKQKLAELDALIQSVFYDMFGDPQENPQKWPVGTIRELATDVKYGTSKPANKGAGKYPYLRMNNITYTGGLDLSNLKYIDMDKLEAEKYLVQKGDLLFNRTNSKELVGKTAVFNSDMPMIIAGYIIRVRLNEKAHPMFVSAYLNSKYGKAVLYGMCKSIIGQANINAKELQAIRIFVPPIALQTHFAETVSVIDEQKSLMQKSIDEAQTLFDAIMAHYFE